MSKILDDASTAIRLYFDDSGQRAPDRSEGARLDGMDSFALGGILIDEENVPSTYERHQAFMNKWNLSDPLHSTKIRGHRDQFRWLKNSPDQLSFYYELNELLTEIPVVGIACVIDRPGYNARYEAQYGRERWRMCKTATSILVERAVRYARDKGRYLKISFEASGEREDRDILRYVADLKIHGMPFNPETSRIYGSLPPDTFREVILGDPERITKKSGLMQIADLYLYPMMKAGYDRTYEPYVRLWEARRLIDTLLPPEEIPIRGIKYSCFDGRNTKGSETRAS